MPDAGTDDARHEPGAAVTATGGTITPLRPAAVRRKRAGPSPPVMQDRVRERSSRHNLPLQLTSFVGREQALAELGHLLARTRLLTLTGAPGVGKSRLSLQLAGEALDAFADGVWLVELAPLVDPILLPHAVAEVLGVQEQSGRPLMSTLADALRHQQILLVLDNCEHLIDACAALAERLLRACAQVEIVATSREPLGIGGETAWPVPSLVVPGDSLPRSAGSMATFVECEAMRLFVERAHMATPTFTLTEHNTGAVAQICRRLDGIPLALELAASRVRVLSVEHLAARLDAAIGERGPLRSDDRFRLLTAGSRVALPRQQTLRAAVDWSYALLAEPEQVLLRRLAVFADGWTLEAAEEVCAGDGIAAEDVLELLVQLVNKSLVVVVEAPAGEQRYRLLETLREYGFEKLRESGEEAAVRTRHLLWFVALAQRGYPLEHGAEQAAWYSRLQADQDNQRAAMAWSKLAAERAARTLLDEGLVLAREARSAYATTVSLLILGAIAMIEGDLERAAALMDESLTPLGEVSDEGDRYVAALSSLYWRAGLARFQGKYDRATALLEEGLALARDQHDIWSIAFGLAVLGRVAWLQGDLVRAVALQRESLALRRELADRHGITVCLEGLAWVANGQGQPVSAARLFGAAEALRERIGAVPWPLWLAEHERNVAATRARLGEEAFAAAWAAGRALAVDEALGEALGEREVAPPPAALPARAAGPASVDPLSAREREVAVLIAQGLTNRQIAEQLVISSWTADAHVRHILTKLSFRSRAQVAAWAIEHGLLATGPR